MWGLNVCLRVRGMFCAFFPFIFDIFFLFLLEVERAEKGTQSYEIIQSQSSSSCFNLSPLSFYFELNTVY